MNKLIGRFIFYLLVFNLLLFASNVIGKSIKIYGMVVDSVTNIPLPGAVISDSLTGSIAIADKDGNYFCQLNNNNHVIKCQFLGYANSIITLTLLRDTNITFRLVKSNLEIKEVTVLYDSSASRIKNVQGGIVSLTRKEVVSMPLLLGESDFYRTLQLLPGIQNSGEGNAAIYVRGGGADENLVLLDGAVVYNPAHLLGFYSIFNTDAISDVSFIKAGIPAEYGNRISSVLDFNSKPGIPSTTEVMGNIGVISSHMKVTVPLSDGIGSIFLAFRQTYLNLLLSAMKEINLIGNHSILRNSRYDFYDLNGGVYMEFNHKNKLYAGLYQGEDDFDLNAPQIDLDAIMKWGNKIASLKWAHLISPDLIMENSFYSSGYDFQMNLSQNYNNFNLTSNIQDYGYKNKFSYFNNRNKIKAGLEIIHHSITPNSSTVSADTQQLNNVKIYSYYAYENSIFLSDEYTVTNKLSFVAGLRANIYFQVGPYLNYQYDSFGNITDTLEYPTGKIIQAYHGLEPRLSVRYLVGNDASIKFSYNYNNQYIHLVSTSSVAFPTDFWIPSTKDIEPLTGNQWAAGFYKNITHTFLETSLEVYYKNTYHQLEFKNDLFQLFNNTPTDENLIFGKGRSYGVELLIRRTSGRINGWIGYTLSKTMESFAQIEQGQWFPAKYDRTHNASCIINFALNKKWSFSTVFIYSTGSAYTPVVGRYLIAGNVINQYGSYNSARMPDYSRLDISATYVLSSSKLKSSRLIFSVYNVYDRQNPFFIYPQTTGNIFNFTLNVEPGEISIFPILPSVSWQFSF